MLVGVYDNAPGKVSGSEMKELPCLNEAWLACDNGLISTFGTMNEFPGIENWKRALEVMTAAIKL